MIKTKSAGGVVLNKDGKILVVSQHGTSWSLPKGHVEKGEDLEVAARREIYEESGIKDIEFHGTLGTYQRHKIDRDGKGDPNELKTITIFFCTTNEDALKPVDPENPVAKWAERERV